MDKQLASARAWSFLDNLNEGVLIVKMDGSIVYCNQTATKQLGLKQNNNSITELEFEQTIVIDWKTLLSPPAKQLLHSQNGRSYEFNATPYTFEDQQLIQITINAKNDAPTEAVNQLAALTRISKEADFNKQLRLLVDSLTDFGWNRVVLSLRDKDFSPTELLIAGFTKEEETYLSEHMLPGEAWFDLFTSEENELYKHGDCFLVPETSAWSQKYLNCHFTRSRSA